MGILRRDMAFVPRLSIRLACFMVLLATVAASLKVGELSAGRLQQSWQSTAGTPFPSWVPLSGRDNTVGCWNTRDIAKPLGYPLGIACPPATHANRAKKVKAGWGDCTKPCRTCYAGEGGKSQCTSCNDDDVLKPQVFGHGKEQQMKGLCVPTYSKHLYSSTLANCFMSCEDGAGGWLTSYQKFAGVAGGKLYKDYTYVNHHFKPAKEEKKVANIYCYKAGCKKESHFESTKHSICRGLIGHVWKHDQCRFRVQCMGAKMVACKAGPDPTVCEVTKEVKPVSVLNLKSNPPTDVPLSLFTTAERTAMCYPALADN